MFKKLEKEWRVLPTGAAEFLSSFASASRILFLKLLTGLVPALLMTGCQPSIQVPAQDSTAQVASPTLQQPRALVTTENNLKGRWIVDSVQCGDHPATHPEGYEWELDQNGGRITYSFPQEPGCKVTGGVLYKFSPIAGSAKFERLNPSEIVQSDACSETEASVIARHTEFNRQFQNRVFEISAMNQDQMTLRESRVFDCGGVHFSHAVERVLHLTLASEQVPSPLHDHVAYLRYHINPVIDRGEVDAPEGTPIGSASEDVASTNDGNNSQGTPSSPNTTSSGTIPPAPPPPPGSNGAPTVVGIPAPPPPPGVARDPNAPETHEDRLRRIVGRDALTQQASLMEAIRNGKTLKHVELSGGSTAPAVSTVPGVHADGSIDLTFVALKAQRKLREREQRVTAQGALPIDQQVELQREAERQRLAERPAPFGMSMLKKYFQKRRVAIAGDSADVSSPQVDRPATSNAERNPSDNAAQNP